VFFETLRKEWPGWSPPLLPRALLAALRSARRFVGKCITVDATPESGMLFLVARERASAERLTPAEAAVARLIAHGRSYKEAARELSRSPATVRNQLHSVYTKLEIDNNVALTRLMSQSER
jgi:DNA-binding NarL/FixJ family response regulator